MRRYLFRRVLAKIPNGFVFMNAEIGGYAARVPIKPIDNSIISLFEEQSGAANPYLTLFKTRMPCLMLFLPIF